MFNLAFDALDRDAWDFDALVCDDLDFNMSRFKLVRFLGQPKGCPRRHASGASAGKQMWAVRRTWPHTMRNSALHFIADIMPPRGSEHSHGIFHTTITPRWVGVKTAALGGPGPSGGEELDRVAIARQMERGHRACGPKT